MTNTQRFQVWHGTISDLKIQAIHVHYLKGIKQQQQLAGAVAIAQAAAHEAGAVFSAQATTDEGDPVDGFTMLLNGKPVQGSFWKATFKNGDRVQVVGEDIHGVIRAVAVTFPEERVIWMQPHCERGTKAKKNSVLSASALFLCVSIFVQGILSIFSSPPYWPMILGLSLATFTTLFLTAGLSWRDFMAFALEMNSVGDALGIPEPEKIDLIKSTKLARRMGKPDLPLGVYYY